MKFNKLILSTLVAFTALIGVEVRADNMASIAIAPSTGAVTLTPRWAIGGSLSGFHHMAQDLSVGGGPNQFYSIKGTAIPSGGDIAAFTRYIAASGAATNHADIGSKLTPSSYSALTSADPDIGYGAVNLYFIHHKTSGDYFTAIVPSSGVASAVTDLKPMSGPGGPATLGASGYFGLTFAAANLGYGLNYFYYLRTDSVTGNTKFGTLDPALLGTSADKFDLGTGGHNALAFTGTDVGFGTNKMYYLRLDPVTGYTILGTLNPSTGRPSDIANLGSVYSTLTFVPGDVSFGSAQFYTTGAVNTTWQSVSFAALADRAISAGSFTVAPSASSALPITLTVVAGSTGSASISGPVAGVFTVTPTAPGVITLQATQAGQTAPAYEYNMLRQSFTATGVALLAITTQPTAQTAVAGSTATFSVTASGATAVSYQWRKAGVAITGNASATTATLSLPNVQAADAASYDVVVTNSSGSITSSAFALTVTAAPPATTAPVFASSSLTAAATTGTAFSYTIPAAGTPTSYTATGLPAGLTLNTATGAITGTPTTSGTSVVTVTATNSAGTATATLTITSAAANVAPIITSPTTAPGTAGVPITPYVIVATGTPTSYTATGLPAGLTLNPTTGAITGTPTASGTSVVTITATNSAGTTTSTLTITVAAAAGSPVITSPATAPATAGTPFNTYVIAATGAPTSYTATGLPAGLTLNATTGAITGTPTTAGTSVVTITATNSAGTTTATLTITVAAASSSRIVNFSARAVSGPGSQTLIMGFVVAGDGKNLLVRGIGPTLTALGIANALADPMLTLFNPDGAVASNDDWQTTSGGQDQSALIAATSARVGAFALPSGSKDSALLYTVNNGAHTTGLLRSNSTSGVALTEVYDTDTTLGARLTNVSARMNVTTGEGTLIAGLVIAGNAPKTVLIRGVGPTLTAFGVTGALADPQIAVFSGATLVASNDDWETGTGNAALIIATSARVGAFALPVGSKDAALLVTLQPGVYTVHVTGVSNTTGVALVEVYDTP